MPTKNTGTPSVSPRFALGQVVATPAVLEHLERHGVNASEYLNRHVRGDWGDVRPEDAKENEFAVARRLRLLSSYTIAGERVWIITEAERNSTCLLFPSEY
jgi:hypothetical protein